ncbi:MAG TPA: TrpB-like pyridoxal phosphate-dependent enzyme [Leptospiraceae bacterium]|nr:TrpB-like pyridoxal phosphate-dependent enzyme [Leptospiraceae bacterium]HMZ60750.1 TrpB-like pyridoxal phosphate-dependent enzyme [Leptospiraceae bacterium]HNF14017.1 TrpB-like pyridoxal phosphate-dependent enzyme [Leptospiraceae bacterium]HNF24581.1 TrpB-like pyridoxal phosphate-dependent enzyme [Leptospiraceae bacterium]HNH07358.1 TrpB-like pyridoxal phosphate-dependent enzyme [Leptospiraceae bacterium]
MENKIILTENEIPRNWYNIQADMPNPVLPPLHPGTKQPVGPDDLAPLFPMELIKQEVTRERYVEIPEEVRDIYKIWRPTPLFRAHRLEKFLDTPAKIYYKYEGVSPAGSHKPNTAVPQAYYNKKEGVKRITTETGAGQWGSALSFACNIFGIELEVYMVKISYQQKPYRKAMMNTWGAKVYASPTDRTESGRKILAGDPNSPGSLGIAISEAVERAAMDPDTKYALGSVLNHVLLHQTIVGQEAMLQMEKAGDLPDIVIAPFGGGSNFAGLTFPFLRLNFTEGKKIRCIAVEPASCPKLTKGEFRYDFGDTVGLTPLIPMYTLGHSFVPASIHAGGLRYHGAGAIVSQLLKDKLIEASALQQLECFEAGVAFAKTEGILPAPEATHGIAEVFRQAKQAKIEGKSKTILFNLCGHGYLDLGAYEDYLSGKLKDHEISDTEVKKYISELDAYPAIK